VRAVESAGLRCTGERSAVLTIVNANWRELHLIFKSRKNFSLPQCLHTQFTPRTALTC
jgi:hypothetical protein